MHEFSSFNNIFCDSNEALNWAYSKNLPREATVRSSSPAVILNNNHNVTPVDQSWTVDNMREFQNSIQGFSENIFDAAYSVKHIQYLDALLVAYTAASFQKILFKAACVSYKDLVEPRLVIDIKIQDSRSNGTINPPWGEILELNPNLKRVVYSVKKSQSTPNKKVSLLSRLRVSGIEGLVYRFFLKFIGNLPLLSLGKWRGKVLISSENELVIETAYNLILNRVYAKEIGKNAKISTNYDKNSSIDKDLISSIYPILHARFSRWLIPEILDHTISMFLSRIKENFDSFYSWELTWNKEITPVCKEKTIVLMNSPVNIREMALAKICYKNFIPIVAFQHGVSKEISKLHGEFSIKYETNISDIFFTYNDTVKDKLEKSHLCRSEIFSVGMSKRHIHMKQKYKFINIYTMPSPILFLSSNIYKGNIGDFATYLTDCSRAKKEYKIVDKVLSKLPHKVVYKSYPEETKRYADIDPVTLNIKNYSNIDLYDTLDDARYSLNKYSVIIVSGATSTISWALMSGNPVVLINAKQNLPLSDDMYTFFSEGLFVFNDDESDFIDKLRLFLSLPISEINNLWNEKKNKRELIHKFINSHFGDAGIRSSKLLLNRYYV